MDDSSYRLNFDPDKNNENIIIALIIEHPNKLVKLPNLVAKCCKIRKFLNRKFACLSSLMRDNLHALMIPVDL